MKKEAIENFNTRRKYQKQDQQGKTASNPPFMPV